jgi:hypothetical protein
MDNALGGRLAYSVAVMAAALLVIFLWPTARTPATFTLMLVERSDQIGLQHHPWTKSSWTSGPEPGRTSGRAAPTF